MFADPQTVTIDVTPHTLARVGVGSNSAVYSNADGTQILTISHQTTKGGRVRRQVRLDSKKIAADPFVTGINRTVTLSTYFVVNEPTDGAYANAEVVDAVLGLTAFLSEANVTKVLGGES